MRLHRSSLPLAFCLLLFNAVASRAQDATLLAWGQQPSLEDFSSHLAPTVPSPKHAIDKMLEVANLKPGETLFDLGCGDGRILTEAAKRYHVNAVGIEISASYARKAVERARREGVQDHVKVIHGNFMKEDLASANVVTLYLATAANDTVRPNLERELKPNTRVVSYDYPIPGWKAIDTFDTLGRFGDSHVIYLYQVPASIINKKVGRTRFAPLPPKEFVLKNFDVVGIGLNATDTLLLVQEFPPYAGKVPLERELLSPGGQVATAMVSCSRLGLRAKYIGTVGDDHRGDIQRQSLEGTGVDIGSVIIRANCPNQVGYIIIDQRTGERTVLWHREGALRLSADEIAPDDIISSRMLHIDGYDTDAAAYAARLARQHGVPVSIDIDSIYPNFEPVLQNVDYLVAGSGWPAKWTGESDPFKALSALQSEYGMKVAAMTLGDYGSLARGNGRWYYSPAFEVSCVDTTGAGDVYHGAFCYAILEGMPLQPALEFANAAAALNCKAIGARGNVPSKSDVDALINRARTGKVRRREDPEVCARVAAQASSVHSSNAPAIVREIPKR